MRPSEPRTRVNEAIRVPEVRLIDDDGSQIGVKQRDEALEYAWAKNLDLVEVAPDARPPVCRVMDYGKYRYDQEQKQKIARKHQSTITIKEIKLRPKIDPHDYETKKGHVVRFLKHRDKVKVTIMFRGREMQHPERGRMLLERLAEDVAELGVIESEPLQDGRNMVMLLGPVKEAVAAKPTPNEDGEPTTEAGLAASAEVAPPVETEVPAEVPAEVEAEAPAEVEAAAPAEPAAAAKPTKPAAAAKPTKPAAAAKPAKPKAAPAKPAKPKVPKAKTEETTETTDA